MRLKTSFVWLMMAGQALAAVTLSNFSATQREGSKLVDIYFDADNDSGSTLAVSILVSNGTSHVSATSFFGDYGGIVSEGANLHVVWDGGADLPDLGTSNLSITVQLSDPVPAGMAHIPAGTNTGFDPDFGSYSLAIDDLLMDETEITGGEWENVYDWAILNGYTFTAHVSAKGSQYPVVLLTWYDGYVWCNARSEMEGLTPRYTFQNGSIIKSSQSKVTPVENIQANGYRLPRDQEFQYAARGGRSGLRFPWGDSISHDEANYYATQSYSYDISDNFGHHPDYDDGSSDGSNPVRDFSPNGYGLYGMSGNVWEWCWNQSNGNRSQRSGSFGQDAFRARCGHRDLAPPTAYNYFVGFRTVRNFVGEDQQTQTISFDSRDYELTVVSAFGNPVPMVGTSHFAWRSSISCSVEQEVVVDGTNYICIGWSGTGSVPMVGSGNEVAVFLTGLVSAITWNWIDDDVDLDGLSDKWEELYFGNLEQKAGADYDSDGHDNYSEFIAGTIPTNPSSVFQLQKMFDGNNVIITWSAVSNRVYNLYWTDNLQYTGFQPLETNMTFPRNATTTTISGTRSYFKADVTKP